MTKLSLFKSVNLSVVLDEPQLTCFRIFQKKVRWPFFAFRCKVDIISSCFVCATGKWMDKADGVSEVCYACPFHHGFLLASH